MIATLRYFAGRVKRAASEADWEVASMDDEALFGPVPYNLSLRERVDLGARNERPSRHHAVECALVTELANAAGREAQPPGGLRGAEERVGLGDRYLARTLKAFGVPADTD